MRNQLWNNTQNEYYNFKEKKKLINNFSINYFVLLNLKYALTKYKTH